MENLVKLAADLLEMKRKEASEKGLLGIHFANYCAKEAATYRKIRFHYGQVQ